MPNDKQWQDFRESLMTIKSNMADKIEIGKGQMYNVQMYENVRQNETR